MMDTQYKQKFFKFWCSYYDTAKDLPDDERLAFYDTIMAYMFDHADLEKELKNQSKTNAYFAFKGVKANLKASRTAYDNGSKGGRPKKENACSIDVSENENQNETKTKPSSESVKPSENQNETYFDTANNTYKEEKRDKEKKSKEKRDKEIKGKEERDKGKREKGGGKASSPLGSFKNVFLTDAELSMLNAKVSNPQSLIESLSAYIASKGVRYESHYATLISWAERDGRIKRERRTCAREGCGSRLTYDSEKGWQCPYHGTNGVTS